MIELKELNRTIWTDYGIIQKNKWATGDEKLNIAEYALGDEDYEVVGDETSLKNEVYRNKVTHVTIDPNDKKAIRVGISIPPGDGGFIASEIGLFDIDGGLLAIGTFTPVNIPVEQKNEVNTVSYTLTMKTSNTDAFEIKIDPNIEATLHMKESVTSKEGVHGSRYWEDKLWFENSKNEWEILETGREVIVKKRNPTTTEQGDFDLGDIWFNVNSGDIFIVKSIKIVNDINIITWGTYKQNDLIKPLTLNDLPTGSVVYDKNSYFHDNTLAKFIIANFDYKGNTDLINYSYLVPEDVNQIKEKYEYDSNGSVNLINSSIYKLLNGESHNINYTGNRPSYYRESGYIVNFSGKLKNIIIKKPLYLTNNDDVIMKGDIGVFPMLGNVHNLYDNLSKEYGDYFYRWVTRLQYVEPLNGKNMQTIYQRTSSTGGSSQGLLVTENSYNNNPVSVVPCFRLSKDVYVKDTPNSKGEYELIL